MWERCLTKTEKELIEILKTRELTKQDAENLGYKITEAFLIKCEHNNILIYEYPYKKNKTKYGVLKE